MCDARSGLKKGAPLCGSFDNWGGGGGDWNIDGDDFLLWLSDLDDIGVWSLWSNLSSGVVGKHNLDLKSDNTLSEHNVSDGGVDVLSDGVTSVDHKTVSEFHGLGSLTSQLAGDDDFATLSSRLHDESENTVGGTSDGETTLELVSERFALSDGAETSVGDLFGEELNGAVLDLESLLDQSGQFSDSLGLVSQNVLGSGSENDDFGSLGGDSDFDARVTVLGEFLSEVSVEFSSEDALGDMLSLLGDVGASRGHDYLSSETSLLDNRNDDTR